MIRSPMTALRNASNPYQGKTLRILCVCSIGMLRSPTLANLLHTRYGYNTRSCGIDTDTALVPISTVLTEWAQVIVCLNDNIRDRLVSHLSDVHQLRLNIPVMSFGVPDDYQWHQPELVDILNEKIDNLLIPRIFELPSQKGTS